MLTHLLEGGRHVLGHLTVFYRNDSLKSWPMVCRSTAAGWQMCCRRDVVRADNVSPHCQLDKLSWWKHVIHVDTSQLTNLSLSAGICGSWGRSFLVSPHLSSPAVTPSPPLWDSTLLPSNLPLFSPLTSLPLPPLLHCPPPSSSLLWTPHRPFLPLFLPPPWEPWP